MQKEARIIGTVDPVARRNGRESLVNTGKLLAKSAGARRRFRQ
jgi:hypothetical protein